MNQLTEYSPTEAALAELRQRYADVAWDLTTTKGDKEARAARKELVTLRTALEAKRQELKAPALERSRLIDAEAARIKAEIEALEKPIDAQIKADEVRRERERQEKAKREAIRIAGHQAALDAIRSIPLKAMGAPVAELRHTIGTLEATAIGPDFEEFQPLAERAKADGLEQLRGLLAKAETAEAEAKRLAEERAELDRQRAEQARLAAEAAEARRREEAAAAEQRRQQEAEAAAAKAKLEAEAREARERIERQEREARDRIAEQERQARADRDAAEAAARAAREAQEAVERAARQAEEDRQLAEREAAEARDRAERARLDGERRAEEERQLAEQRARERLQHGRDLLGSFLDGYADDPEFAGIVPAIREFLQPLKVAA